MNIVMIAEKPSVAEAYTKALELEPGKRDIEHGYFEGVSKWDGNHYYVTYSFGHLVTLSYPETYDSKYKQWNFDDLPFLPEKYRYEVIKDSKKQFENVKALYHRPDTDMIIYAGDSGREGLYIQCLIRMLAGTNKRATEKVLWIDSQTTDEIRRGLSAMKPLSAYANYEKAGFMRAIEDFAFGINYSRMLSAKYGKAFNERIKSSKWKTISVGRVMTCVLGMIVDRERAIKNFTSIPFYKVYADCEGSDFGISADWLVDKDSKYYDSPLLYENKGFKQVSDANAFISELLGNPNLTVESVEDKLEKKKAPLLYNLAELQNDCSKRFKIGPNETLAIAQKLYESKLTTYPRTDARYLSTAICKEIDKNLTGLSTMGYDTKFVKQILDFGMYSGLEKTVYCNDSKITDHYAIIPTGQGSVTGLSDIELKVYQMIVDRFVCIFMPQAEYNHSTAILRSPANNERFKISMKSLIKLGYLEVIKGKSSEEDEDELEDGKLSDYLKKGDVLKADFGIEEGRTTPPKRYTSGSIILAMENAGNLIEDEELRAQIKGSGIGTSATRAGIIEKLSKIGYININKKTQVLTPHEDGEAIYDIVAETIPNFLSPEMTASWEKGLSQIEEGLTTREEYTRILEKEIRKTHKKLSEITVEGESFTSVDTGKKCPYCNGAIMTTKKGFKCERNLSKDEGCSFYFGEISGVKMTESDLADLLNDGQTKVKTFKKKDKKGTFDAMLKLNIDEQKIEFAFSERESDGFESEDTGFKCPFCGEAVITTRTGYKCSANKSKDEGCSFYIGNELSGAKITKDVLRQLLTEEKTSYLTFVSKKKTNFVAALQVNKEDQKIDFVFQPRNL